MQNSRAVLVSGAAGGVGSLLVERFLANGDVVVATDSRLGGLEALRERHAAEAGLHTAGCDVSSEQDCAALMQVAEAAAGRVDVLVNCAGFFPVVPFEQMAFEQWQRVIEINLNGTYLMCRAALPLMKHRGWGRIVNFASGSVFAGTPGQAHYVAAKAGVIGFSRSLAREVGGYGITVNVVAPGLTVTQAVRDTFPPEVLAGQRSRRALQRDEQPEDLVGPVFFLASRDAEFITGQTLNVDGGNFML